MWCRRVNMQSTSSPTGRRGRLGKVLHQVRPLGRPEPMRTLGSPGLLAPGGDVHQAGRARDNLD